MPFPIIPVIIASGLTLLGGIIASESGRSSGGSRSYTTSDENEARNAAVEREKSAARARVREDIERYFNENLSRILTLYEIKALGKGNNIVSFGLEDIINIIASGDNFVEAVHSCFADGCEDLLNLAAGLEEHSGTIEELMRNLADRSQNLESPEGLIGAVKKYTGAASAKSFITEAIAAYKQLGVNETVIVNTGLLKAGKSSLFNAIFESAEKFRTKSVRATIENQAEHLCGRTYIDTPGIDAQEADEVKARFAIKKADVVIYVFNLDCGGLEKKEIDYLKSLTAGSENSGEKFSNFIFVGTFLDKIEASQNISASRIVDHARKQLEDNFGITAGVICVSSPRYLKGITEGKEELIKRSGFNELKTAIAAKLDSNRGAIENARKSKYRAALNKVIKTLAAECEKTKTELNLITNTILTNSASLKAGLEELLEGAAEKIKQYKNI